MKNIKVAIADDHNLFIRGMESMIEKFDGIEMMMEAENGKVLIKKLKTQRPNVILMDLRMPVMGGLEATGYIRKKYPKIKIIAITMYDEEIFIINMMKRGANGYLHKNAEPKEVEDAIHSVMENNFYFNNYVSKAMLSGLIRGNTIHPFFNPDIELSKREIEILKMICNEFTNSEIAEKLNLSIRTIEGYRENLMVKTGARNIVGLVVYALKNYLVDLELRI